MDRLAPRQQSRNGSCASDARRIDIERRLNYSSRPEMCSVSRLSRQNSFGVNFLASLMASVLIVVLIFGVFASAQSGRSRTVSGQQRPAERPRQTQVPTVNLPPPPPPPIAKPVSTSAPVPPVSGTLPPAVELPVTSDEASATDMGGDEIIDVRSNLVPVSASVVDAKGAPLLGLGVRDFELLVDGIRKPVSDVSRAESPVQMAMLFDNSASLTRARELEKEAAMRFFSRVMRPIDQAAIFSVTHNVQLEQHLTNNVARLIRTIKRFGPPDGATSLLDAVAESAAYLKPQQGRKVIIIVSDGVDTTSRLDFAESLRRAQAADCQIYAVQTGQSMNANLRDLTAERRLQELTAQTGGAVYTPANGDELDPAFTQISADLAQQYILSYYPTGEAPDGKFRRIAVRVLNKHNVRVRARTGYYSGKG